MRSDEKDNRTTLCLVVCRDGDRVRYTTVCVRLCGRVVCVRSRGCGPSAAVCTCAAAVRPQGAVGPVGRRWSGVAVWVLCGAAPRHVTRGGGVSARGGRVGCAERSCADCGLALRSGTGPVPRSDDQSGDDRTAPRCSS